MTPPSSTEQETIYGNLALLAQGGSHNSLGIFDDAFSRARSVRWFADRVAELKQHRHRSSDDFGALFCPEQGGLNNTRCSSIMYTHHRGSH